MKTTPKLRRRRRRKRRRKRGKEEEEEKKKKKKKKEEDQKNPSQNITEGKVTTGLRVSTYALNGV